MRFIHTESETVEKAKSQTEHNLRELVGQEVDTWDEEKLRQEAYQSAEIITSESRYHPEIHSLIIDRALTMWQDDMSRVDTDLISGDISDSQLVKCHDMWPNDMDKWHCREILSELKEAEIPAGYLSDACQEVQSGIYKELMDI